LKAVNSI